MLSQVADGVWTSPSGFIFCDYDDAAWCSHIETAIRSGFDGSAIFDDLANYDITRVMVPILPIDWHIYALIGLEESEVRKGVFRARLRNSSKSWSNDSKEGEFIGLFCRGDGRMALRSLVIEWLTTKELRLPTRCQSLLHTKLAEYRVTEEVARDQRALMAHCWCLYWYNKCAHCTLTEGPEAKHDPDLIPSL
jgi:hypothetical protein